MKNFTLLALLMAGALISTAQTVTSLSSLQTAINNAAPGAVIILANGKYTASTDITISKQGTATQPITIKAQTIGGAEITGTAGFNIVSPASYIIIRGFKFTNNASQSTMASGTSFCRWTHNLFQTPGDGEDLLLNGNDHEVDYNTFQHKNALGRFIAVRGTGSQIAQRLHIHHNYFFDQQPQTGNGAETLQFGLSGYSLSNSNSIVEYNVFEQCAGENELISVKASQLTIRYNTIRDCPAQFTLRHGNRSSVYGNYFVNTPGLRIFGDDHTIFSNHFENCNPAINVGNGDGEVADGAPLTSHDRPDRALIAFNTLVNNTGNIVQNGRTNGLGATDITIANNIIQGGGPAASIAGPYTGGVWSGNILFNTNGAGDMPSSGYTTVDPRLARDATGSFHLQAGSPAINSATGSYPSVTVDMDGQPRSAPLDKGADEVSTAPVIAHILSAAEAGYAADTATACQPVTASSDDGNVPANVLDGNLSTRWSANGDGQWIQFCLGSSTTVTGVQIAFYSGDTRSSTFDVLTGADGVNWTTAAAGLVSSGTSLNLQTFSFTARTAQYVRIVGHGNSVNTWNSYTEVKILTGSSQTVLGPVQDAYVRNGADAGNAPGASDPTELVSKLNSNPAAGNDRHAYLTFDVGGSGGVLSSATLRLFGKLADSRSSNIPVGVYAVADTNWTESALTWNNAPDTGALLQSVTVTDSVARWYSWDITSYINSARTAGSHKISLALLCTQAATPILTWNSKETGNNAPQLVVQTSNTVLSQQKTMTAAVAQLKQTAAATLNAFPNPFREGSTITFHLDEAGPTNLSVYDGSGRLLKVLVNGQLPAGDHYSEFRAPAAGVYLLKLFHNGGVITKKVLRE